MQRPPQRSWPIGHSIVFVHVPEMQLSPIAQALPQRPQFAGSLRTSTHEPEQFVWSGGHMLTQRPLEQTALAAQRFPQPPQFAGSACGFTQTPLHATSPGRHVGFGTSIVGTSGRTLASPRSR